MSFILIANGFVCNIDLFVAQPPVNHSLTRKPPGYKNNVQTVNALYLQLLKMQKAFIECCEHQTLSNLPTSDEIKELQTDYNNMLTAIINLLDGAKYLWEGEHHEAK